MKNLAKTNNIGGIYKALEWLMWMMYLNLLWIIGSLVGLIIIGVFPATIALVTVMREWLAKEEEVRFTKTFITTYKREFLRSNGVGLILTAILYLLYLNFQFVLNMQGSFQTLMQIGLMIVGILFVILSLYIFPTYAHFDISFRDYFKHAFLLGVFSPLMTLIMIGLLVLFQFILRWIPGLIPVIGVSVTFFIITSISLIAFERFETSHKVLHEKQPKEG